MLANLDNSVNASERPKTEPVPTTTEPSDWERQKWQAEYQLKVRELDLKQQEQRRATWSNPLVVAILAAAVAGFSSAGVAIINGHLQREMEKNKSIESFRIEESRSEADRILEMIKTGEPDKAASNLQFLIDTGLITERARVQQIQSYLAQRTPGTGPFLPSSGRYEIIPSGAVNKSVTASLETTLNDFIRYLDRLGLRGASERVSIEVVEGPHALSLAYYTPDPPKIVLNKALVGDIDPPRRTYVLHFLSTGRAGPNLETLKSGLAWYFPCSFAGRSLFGEETARVLKLDDRRGIGDLAETQKYEGASGSDWSPYVKGAMWGSMLWKVRSTLGQKIADDITVQAWLKTIAETDPDKDKEIGRKFDNALLAATAGVSVKARDTVRSILAERGFPV